MVNRCLIYTFALLFSNQIFAQRDIWEDIQEYDGKSEVIGSLDYTNAIVSVDMEDRDDCQGVLLSNNIVLTTKKCFSRTYANKPPITKDDISVSTLNNPKDEFDVAEIIFQPECENRMYCRYAILKLKSGIYLKGNEYAKLESMEPIPKEMRTMIAHSYELIYERNKRGKKISLKKELRIKSYQIKRKEIGAFGLIDYDNVGTQGAPIFTHNSTQLIISGIYSELYEKNNPGFLTVMYDHISYHLRWISINSGIDIKKLLYSKN
ncbi:hypothetical protein AYI69_g1867 [Smittium culicis]|uniref:Peptidase S1 domain-containing protein n=1 Tax=Smittium culicis TaxID=133412 RepID=A0A1R1YP43_9FUNG|nr:hypothetical protein AYI69_g1867 [Smittium culicis]